MLIKFFDIEPYKDVKLPHYKGKGKTRELVWEDIKRMANRLPTLRNFAKKIKVSSSTVYLWVEKHKEFSDAFTHAKELRKWFLIENGLNGCYNPLFAKFVAVNITDMKEQTEQIVKGELVLKLESWLKEIDGSGIRSPIEQIRGKGGRTSLEAQSSISRN